VKVTLAGQQKHEDPEECLLKLSPDTKAREEFSRKEWIDAFRATDVRISEGVKNEKPLFHLITLLIGWVPRYPSATAARFRKKL
jgi:hypothetical protein